MTKEDAKKSNVIARSVAESEFDRFAETWDIDTDKENMDEDDKQGFENARNQFIRAVISGRLSVSEDGEHLNQTLRDNETITFKIPKGAAWLTIDQHKSNRDVRKGFAYLAAMCGKPVGFFSNMDGRDVKVSMLVMTLFLA